MSTRTTGMIDIETVMAALLTMQLTAGGVIALAGYGWVMGIVPLPTAAAVVLLSLACIFAINAVIGEFE